MSRIKSFKNLGQCRRKDVDVQSRDFSVTTVNIYILLVVLEVTMQAGKSDVVPVKQERAFIVRDIALLLTSLDMVDGITQCGNAIHHTTENHGVV